MGKTLSILGIVGAALAAITATILGGLAPAVVALFAIGAGIYLAISRDWRRMAPGILAAVLGIVGILGLVGSVGGENGGVDFPISAAMGQAFTVIAALAISGAAVLLTWKRLEPEWISYVWAGAWALASLLAIVYASHLGDQTLTGSYVVAVLCLANLGAPIMRLLHGE